MNHSNEALESKLQAHYKEASQKDEKQLVQECVERSKRRKLEQINVGEIFLKKA